MPDTPTPGQTCYEVYTRMRFGLHAQAQVQGYYHTLFPDERIAWEAAAEAARMAYKAEMAQAWAQGEAQRHA